MKKIINYIIIFILIMIFFNIILAVTSLYPSKWIEEHVIQSSNILLNEGNHYCLSSKFNIINNNYTDSIMINEAYSIDNQNPIFSYMSGRKNFKKGMTKIELLDTEGELISITDGEEYDPVTELHNFVNGKVDTSIEYARYWHGYLPILRTMLIFFNISSIRFVYLILFFSLFVSLLVLLKKRIDTRVSIIFGIGLIFYEYFYVSYSLESSHIFITMIISCIWLLIRIDKIKNFYLYIFIVACISNFVDYLTVPLITLALPLYIYIIYNRKNNKFTIKEEMRMIVIASIVWGIGYSLTWVSKWILYDVIYNRELVKSAITQVLYRTSRENELTSMTICNILLIFFLKNCKYIFIGSIIIYLYALAKAFNKNKYEIKVINNLFKYLKSIIPLLTIAILPIIWYVILANHTVLHIFFVHRHMLINCIGILLCVYESLSIKKI